MPSRLRLLYSLLMVTLLTIPVLTIVRELFRSSDIWWTPLAMASSLPGSEDRVEVYVHSKPLAELLAGDQLWIRADTESRPVTAQEIRFRFNNSDRIRARRLPLLLVDAASCGAGAVLLLLIATGRLAFRGEPGSVAA
jgi:hypothetical protein